MFATHPNLQVTAAQLKLVPQGRCLSHAEACRLFVLALSERGKQIVIDLARMEEATTSAFAQLVLLRRTLLRDGRDLCLTGLRDRTAGLFEVNRLAGVLPTT
jgi:anti-anti-sigma regulatory factor